MKKVHTTLVALAMAAAVAGAWWLQNRSAAGGTPAAAALVTPDAAAKPGATAAARGAGPGGVAGGGAVAVEVKQVRVMRLEDEALTVGSLRANQGVMLRPEVSGRVQRLGFSDGQRVRKGQVLLQLEDGLQRAQFQQADAQAAIARTNLQRNRELVAQNFVSQSVVDQAGAALDVALAQVALAQAQLERMKVLAPFDAIAGIRNVNLGDYVKDGADLVQLEDLSSMWVDLRLPERYAGRLRVGQSVSLTVEALPGATLTAAVAALDSQLEANGRSLLVRARLANPGGQLRSGMFARARIVFGVREAALTVPEEALVPLGDQQYIVKVVDGAQGKPQGQRLVARIGTRVPGQVEILEGLKPGDRVVVAGHARLMRAEPQALRIVEVGGEAAAASAASVPSAPASATRGSGAGAGLGAGAADAGASSLVPRAAPAAAAARTL